MKKVIAYVHTHWDREWYREFEEFRLRLIEVVDDIIHKLQTGELPIFYFDGQTSAIEDYLEIFPEKLPIIKQLIADKKLYVGPFFCSADEFLTSGESLIRNFYFGLEKSKKWGCKDFIAYLADTFGHSCSMPFILKAAGIDKAVLWRGLGNLPADLNWDGIKTTYLIQGYFNDFLHSDADFELKAQNLKKYIDKIAAKSGEYILLPIGADHLKACDNLPSQIQKLNEYYQNEYEIVLKDPFEYFKNIKDENRKYVSGEFLDNSLNFILPGIYSSRIDIKQVNSLCERKLNETEKFNAINSTFFGKENRQRQIDYAYKMLIKNHAHDSIYACSTDCVSREVLTRFDKVLQISNGIQKRCERDIISDKFLAAINLSNSNFSGIASIWTTKKLPPKYNAVMLDKKYGFDDEILYNINKIPVTEDYTEIFQYAIPIKSIDSFSCKNLISEDFFDTKDIKSGKNFIENKFLSIELKNGKINITDKKNFKKYDNFIEFTDAADVGDSYNFAPIKGDKKIIAKIKSFKTANKNLFAYANVELEIKIPAKSTEKRRSLIAPKHKINLKITLKSMSDFAEFEAEYENKSLNHKLQASFNFKEPVTKTVSEDLFRLVTRNFDPNYDIKEHIPAPRGIELKTNIMPINRFVWTQSAGIITDGLKEAEIYKNSLSITLLRATNCISNPKNPARGTPAGPPLETPDLQMKGLQKAFFAISFVEKPENLYEICDNIFNPPILVFADLKEIKFISVDNANIKITAMKKSEKDELVLRLVNYSDEKEICTLYCANKDVFETDILENKNTPTNNILYFNPNEIKTVKLK